MRVWIIRGVFAGLIALAVLLSRPAAAQSVIGHPPERVLVDANHVDVTNGTIILPQTTELSIGAGAYGLVLTQSYSNVSGWNDSLSGILDVQTYGPQYMYVINQVSWGTGSWTFDPGAGGGSRSADGTVLSFDGVNYLLTLRDGTVITYSQISDPIGCGGLEPVCHSFSFPIQVVYPNGIVLTLHYAIYPGTPEQVRIQSVVSTAGYQIKYVYQSNSTSGGSSGWGAWLARTSAIAINNAVEYCNPDADTCSLSGAWPTATYTSALNTNTVTDPLGRSTTYTYPGGYFGIRTPGSAGDDYQYTLATYTDYDTGNVAAQHVTAATLGSSTWTYSYNETSGARVVTKTDNQSHSTVFNSNVTTESDSYGGTYPVRTLNSMTDALTRTTLFGYPCSEPSGLNTNLYNATAPEGNAVSVTCDSRANETSTTLQAKPGSGLTNTGTTAHFIACTSTNLKICNQPDYTIDARLNRTDYSYDASHGGVLIETLPADQNGVRPQKRYSYAQFYAYVKNAAGALVQAATPVWLRTKVSECHTAASCTGTSDEIVTSYEYGPTGSVNALLVRGKVVTYQGTSLRTCYAYDSIGNTISVTTPRAGLAACP